ncbi:hypothetical protein EB118_10310 [bacterium]|nr:hypothetical protein [bacterium]NDG30449.1 hypothetical protein [bacterium]
MDKNAHPLDAIIDFAWASGADRFWINNAKDELKRLRKEIEFYKQSFEQPAAWAKTNDRNDLFDLRLQNNPYVDQTKVVPLYKQINNEQ